MLQLIQLVLERPEILDQLPYGYNTDLNLVLWEIVILELVLMLPFGYFSAKRAELKNVKIVEIGRGWFGFFYGLARLFFIFGVTVNHGENYDYYTIIAYLLSMLGLTILIFMYEHYKLSKKAPIFTLIGALSSFFTLSGFDGFIPGFSNIDRNIILATISIASTVLLLMMANLYFQIAERFPGLLRRRTLYEFTGLLLLVFGIILDGQYFITNPNIPDFYKLIFPPALAIGGGLIIFTSHEGKPWMFKATAIVVLIFETILFFSHIAEFGFHLYL